MSYVSEDSVGEDEPLILVEGPGWVDAQFYGEWLIAAATAQALWKTPIKDPIFAM